jgi:NADPH-dependent glutamate synthase beta subunit-like oxidoreductase
VFSRGVVFLITGGNQFGPQTFLWDVKAPDVARATRPGHFIMARIDEHGERIPLTVADINVDHGTVTVVIQGVGKTTLEMMTLREGGAFLDFIGHRRSRRESPARAEELEQAIEEGVNFMWLTAPVEILGDASGWVTGMRRQKMELGEPDASGRRRPVPTPGSDFQLDVDTVICGSAPPPTRSSRRPPPASR